MMQYIMFCEECDQERDAEKVGDDYACAVCGNTVDAESGRVYNATEAEDAYRIYKGMKLAGMFKEDWEREEEKGFVE